jgi:hypothetical protein
LAQKYYKLVGVACHRFAFADELKKELDAFLVDNFEISAFTEDEKEKEIIRPLLVSYGMAKREISNGMYWISKIEPHIKKYPSPEKHAIVTDVRFGNEVDRINKMGGVSIHITREGNIPPNEEEAFNDPIVKAKCQAHFVWRNFKNFDVGEDRIYEKAQNFLDSIDHE